ncbi:MAG TPA: hypothetical protein DCM40_09175 [Maribacter sp.]|nr:MAG: hypothetical protein Unbinned4026contig1002_20 [Prokaryotic dsDNA virus sp.]HAI38270.1 hypothetical protein [Maribacter sp.]|tara:strand:+ start:29457 stop:29651 length:195 start_codon:yes stop_codon:yes gene_type:complete
MPIGYVEIDGIKLTRREESAMRKIFFDIPLDSFDKQAILRVKKKTDKYPYNIFYGPNGLYREKK